MAQRYAATRAATPEPLTDARGDPAPPAPPFPEPSVKAFAGYLGELTEMTSICTN